MFKRQPFGPQLLLASCAFAALLATACGNNSERTAANADNRPVGTSGTASSTAERKSIDLTGCVQKADGSYVLTQISRPRPDAASAEKKSDGSLVEREQLYAAQHAYRLSPGRNEDLEKLLGKQVRVSGTVPETSDPVARDEPKGNGLTVGTSGSQDKHRVDLPRRARDDRDDLARIDVMSIEQVGDGCGTRR